MGLYKICEHKGRVRDRCDHAWWGGYRRHRVSLSRWANREIHSKDEATAVLQELRAAVRAGTFDDRGLDVQGEAAPLTFKECTDRYKERHVVANGLALAKTIDYRLKPLLERFADCGLAEIHTADIEDFIADLRKPRPGGRTRGQPLSPASIDRTIELLRHIMNWAVGREYLDRTPFRRGTVTLIQRQREDNTRRRRLTEDEEAKLLEVASPSLRSMIVTALDTGMRRGEMLALRFADVDWARGLIVLRGPTTKSRKTRFVPIATARLRAVLEWLRLDAAGEQKADDALISSDEASEPLPIFYKAWVIVVLKAHGVTLEWPKRGSYRRLSPECMARFRKINLRWHDLRHEYASRLVERGVPLAQVRDLLGHASIITTERYDNQKLENLQAAAAKLEAGKVFTTTDPHGRPTSPLPTGGDAGVPSTNPQGEPVTDDAGTFYQVFIKNPRRKVRSVRSDRALDNEFKSLKENGLEDWLGGRDLNPDNVVQRRRP